MSEVDFLIKQLEYCLNSGHLQPAKILINELIFHKSKINFQIEMNYKCSSHQCIFKKDFSSNDSRDFKIFLPCEHSVCTRCIESYIRDIFDRVGLNNKYICPGCLANYSLSPTLLSNEDRAFLDIISFDRQNQWKAQNDLISMTIKQGFIQVLKSRCFFFKYAPNYPSMKCLGIDRSMKMPECKHKFCKSCIEKAFLIGNKTPPFKCFVEDCDKYFSDEYVRTLLIHGSELARIILPRLRIEGMKFCECPNKNCKLQLNLDSLTLHYICNCGAKVCPRCGKYYHEDLPCAFADISNCKYQKIECKPDDHIAEYRSLYYKAHNSFLWDLHPSKKAELMKRYNIKFNIKKVERIINPFLQKKYDEAKARILSSGIKSDEPFVFHGTHDQYYDTICEGGFKVGGIDIEVSIGHLYGYGVYTATDPTMSIHYYHNKKVIMCKGLTGNIATKALETIEEFKANTQYHSYFVDFHGAKSNFYVFFDKYYVLPYYLITYE